MFDPSGRFTDDIKTVRTGLTSSVDILSMLISLGHKGDRSWLSGDLAEIYGRRHDILPMLKSARPMDSAILTLKHCVQSNS